MRRLKVWKCWTPLRSRLPGRRRRDVRTPIQQTRQIPAALIIANQVDTGLIGAQRRNLQTSAQQGTQTNRRRDILRAYHWLRAERRIIVDYETLQVESRTRKNMNPNIVERNPAPESRTDRAGNPVA